MGALKNRFQCLQGLRVAINSPDDHYYATQWITVAIILHNLVIDVEGPDAVKSFGGAGRADTEGDQYREETNSQTDDGHGRQADEEEGEEKRKRLVEELRVFRLHSTF